MPDSPPSRYRIVERDRRLVVIDQWGGDAPRSMATDRPMTGQASPLAAPQQTKFDGSAELVTHAVYDAKAPRTLRLNPVTATLFSRIRIALVIGAMLYIVAAIWLPWLLVSIPVVLQPGVQKAIRARTTRWIDRLAEQQP